MNSRWVIGILLTVIGFGITLWVAWVNGSLANAISVNERVTVIETKQEAMAENIREIKADVKDIRREVVDKKQ